MLTNFYIYKRISQNKVRQWYLLIQREDINLTQLGRKSIYQINIRESERRPNFR